MSVCAGPRRSVPNGKNLPGHGGSPSQSAAGLDFSTLDRTVQELFSAGLTPSTQQNYRSGSKWYLGFCSECHIHTPFPLTETKLVYFVAWMYGKQLAGSTVKNYLAAVRHTQTALILGDLLMGYMSRLEYVIKGLKRKARRAPRTRLPITLEVMTELRRAWQSLPVPQDAVMLWAAVSTCFFGFLRSGAVTVP